MAMTRDSADEPPKRADCPTITEAADLVALLHEAPRRRAVVTQYFSDHRPQYGVSEYPGDRIEHDGRIIAVIEAGSAADLLNAAIDADVRRDLAAWSACPIRHCHSRHATRWVHPDHPDAPITPGAKW